LQLRKWEERKERASFPSAKFFGKFDFCGRISYIATKKRMQKENIIVMEFINGQELRKLATSDQLSASRVIDIATQIAEGLKAAHAKGITHRDIKSGNIMVTDSGQVKISRTKRRTQQGGATI
jgi:serine/threonine protein kinase